MCCLIVFLHHFDNYVSKLDPYANCCSHSVPHYGNLGLLMVALWFTFVFLLYFIIIICLFVCFCPSLVILCHILIILQLFLLALLHGFGCFGFTSNLGLILVVLSLWGISFWVFYFSSWSILHCFTVISF